MELLPMELQDNCLRLCHTLLLRHVLTELKQKLSVSDPDLDPWKRVENWCNSGATFWKQQTFRPLEWGLAVEGYQQYITHRSVWLTRNEGNFIFFNQRYRQTSRAAFSQWDNHWRPFYHIPPDAPVYLWKDLEQFPKIFEKGVVPYEHLY